MKGQPPQGTNGHLRPQDCPTLRCLFVLLVFFFGVLLDVMCMFLLVVLRYAYCFVYAALLSAAVARPRKPASAAGAQFVP